MGRAEEELDLWLYCHHFLKTIKRWGTVVVVVAAVVVVVVIVEVVVVGVILVVVVVVVSLAPLQLRQLRMCTWVIHLQRF